MRHFLNILFSEVDNELDCSEDPESVVGPAALLLLIGVTEAKSARRRDGSESRQAWRQQALQKQFYVPSKTITFPSENTQHAHGQARRHWKHRCGKNKPPGPGTLVEMSHSVFC